MTGERRALAAAVLAFYGFIYLVMMMVADPPWRAAMGAMALVYGAGFFGLVAGYFWARWYVIGLGMSGMITGVFSIFQIGMEPALLFYGGTHAFISLVLWGNGMSLAFDGRKEWRERFHLDENATHKLGKSVIRLGISLPYIVIYALAPKDGAAEMVFALAAGTLLVAGTAGLARLRGWGVLALGGGAAMLATSLAEGTTSVVPVGQGFSVNVAAAGAAGLLLVVAALAPFARPLVRYVRS